MKPLREYFSRLGKSHGFGIQSPWAYDFVKDVIMEDLPYYAYEEIDNIYYNKNERKRQKLYFRVRNFVHNSNFCVIDICHRSIDDIKNIASTYGEEGCIILENIYDSKEIKDKWYELKNSELLGITFDFYYFAICFMPNAMYKQHYKLNF